MAANTELFAASGRTVPDPTDAKPTETEPPIFVPNYLKNPQFFYATSDKTVFPQPFKAAGADAAAAAAPSAAGVADTAGMAGQDKGSPFAATPGGGSSVNGRGSGGDVQVEIFKHLLRECAELRASVAGLERQLQQGVPREKPSIDVHVKSPQGPTYRVIGAPYDTPLQAILDACPIPKAVANAGTMILCADQDNGILLMHQTCGALKTHISAASPDSPLVLYLGLRPKA